MTSLLYLNRIEPYRALASQGLRVRSMVTAAAPVPTILAVARTEDTDLIMMVSHGRAALLVRINGRLGSVAGEVLEETPCPVFPVSALPSPQVPL